MNGLFRRDKMSRSLNATASHLFSLTRLLSEHFKANLYIEYVYERLPQVLITQGYLHTIVHNFMKWPKLNNSKYLNLHKKN